MIEIEKILSNNNMSDYNTSDRDNIPILGYVKIDENNWGRLDKIVLEQYGSMDFYPLFLDFNNITDVDKLQKGQILDIPDMFTLMNQTNILEILDKDSDENDIIPGVCKSANNKVTNEELRSRNYNSNKTKTTANTKLNITQQTVNYDQLTGMVKF